MKKELTKREKVLIVVLCVILVGVGYFKLVLEPIKNQVSSFVEKTASEQALIDQNILINAEIKKMEKSIDEIQTSGKFREVPSYDNSTQLMKELNKILAAADDYNLSFGVVTEGETIAARPANLNFETETYEEAKAILEKISKSDNVNQIGDLSIKMNTGSNGKDHVSVYLTVTYYELMA